MINLHIPSKHDLLRPTITVVGVGGAGGNAVNNMISARLEGVNFVVANTDAQAVDHSLTERTIQLGANITRGQGAGANPDIGRASAEEAKDEIAAHIEGSNMVFITAGMGGGTGTGAAPVVARIAKDLGILTVAVVTKPFQFEGMHRMRLAEAGLKELQDYVDTLIVIPNQNLFRIANEKTTFSDAFKMADEVLHSGVRGITDLIVKPGLINLDFADIRTVMREMGKAMMGTGEATGDRRAIDAAEAAVSNPLLDDVSLKGARALLINVTGGPDMTLFEVDEATNRVREEVDPEANIIFGATFNDEMNGRMRVSVVATGIDSQMQAAISPNAQKFASIASDVKKPFSFAPVARAPEMRPAAQTAQRFEAPRTPASAADVSRVLARTEEAAREVQQEIRGELQFAKVHDQQVGVTQNPVVSREPASATTPQEIFAEPRFMPAGALANKREEAPVFERAEEEPHGMAGGAKRFFQKVADVGRVLSSRADRVEVAERIQVVQKTMHSEQPRPQQHIHADDEQYLDIPAFLRRQAN